MREGVDFVFRRPNKAVHLGNPSMAEEKRYTPSTMISSNFVSQGGEIASVVDVHLVLLNWVSVALGRTLVIASEGVRG